MRMSKVVLRALQASSYVLDSISLVLIEFGLQANNGNPFVYPIYRWIYTEYLTAGLPTYSWFTYERLHLS